MKVRIAIADEHTIIRRGVLSMITNMPSLFSDGSPRPEFCIQGDTATPSELLSLLSQQPVDILFLGFSLATSQTVNPLNGMDGVLRIFTAEPFNQQYAVHSACRWRQAPKPILVGTPVRKP